MATVKSCYFNMNMAGNTKNECVIYIRDTLKSWLIECGFTEVVYTTGDTVYLPSGNYDGYTHLILRNPSTHMAVTFRHRYYGLELGMGYIFSGTLNKFNNYTDNNSDKIAYDMSICNSAYILFDSNAGASLPISTFCASLHCVRFSNGDMYFLNSSTPNNPWQNCNPMFLLLNVTDLIGNDVYVLCGAAYTLTYDSTTKKLTNYKTVMTSQSVSSSAEWLPTTSGILVADYICYNPSNDAQSIYGNLVSYDKDIAYLSLGYDFKSAPRLKRVLASKTVIARKNYKINNVLYRLINEGLLLKMED